MAEKKVLNYVTVHLICLHCFTAECDTRPMACLALPRRFFGFGFSHKHVYTLKGSLSTISAKKITIVLIIVIIIIIIIIRISVQIHDLVFFFSAIGSPQFFLFFPFFFFYRLNSELQGSAPMLSSSHTTFSYCHPSV